MFDMRRLRKLVVSIWLSVAFVLLFPYAAPAESNEKALERDFAAEAKRIEKVATGNDRDEAFQRLSSEWADKEPQKAAAWAATLPIEEDGCNRPLIELSTVLRQWTKQDPAAATEWVCALPDGVLRKGAICVVIRLWSEKEPRKAAQFVERMPEGESKNDAIVNVVDLWFKSDSESTAAWLVKLPEGKVRDRELSSVAVDLTRQLLKSNKDPGAAAQLVRHLVDTNRIQRACSEIGMIWAKENSQAAEKWVESLPRGLNRDAARFGVIFVRTRDDPREEANQVAQRIDDEAYKSSILRTVIESWARKDPAAAREWVEKSQLPEKAKEPLRNLLINN